MVALIATSGAAMMVKVNVTCRPAESHAFTQHYILCVCVCACACARFRPMGHGASVRFWPDTKVVVGRVGGGGGGEGLSLAEEGKEPYMKDESGHCNP